MPGLRSFPERLAAPALLALAVACADSPGDPLVERLAGARLAIESGDGQVGVRGRPLPETLAVRLEAAGRPVEGIEVRFADEPGGGTFSLERATTGPDGVAGTAYTPGTETGERTIRARVGDGRRELEAVFTVEAVDPPEIDRIEPPAVVAGEALTIEGRNFSPVAEHDEVRVGGLRAEVIEASRTRLVAVAPELGDGVYGVTVSLAGALASGGPVRIASAAVVAPPPGIVATGRGGAGSVGLPYETGDEAYLVAVGSTSLRRDLPLEVTLDVEGAFVESVRAPTAARVPAPEAIDEEARIHAMGRAMLERYGPSAPSRARRIAPAQVRSFHVLTPSGHFELRPARLGFAGRRVAVYVDEEVEREIVPTERARRLGERFEIEAYDPIRATFGEESDVDANGRVILLMTPLVNARSDASGRVLGFFFPGDLSDGPNSNRAEIFYVQVPDPEGRFGRSTTRRVLDENVGVAAHEFVHMISTNERRLRRSLARNPFWLEEGLAHLGEFVAGMPEIALSNVARYLGGDTPGASLGGSGLETRGAATLVALRLFDRFGAAGIGTIVRARGSGEAIVETALGEAFDATFRDWTLAVHNEVFPSPGLDHGYAFFDVAGFVDDALGGAELVGALGRLALTTLPGTRGDLRIRMRTGAVAYVVVTASEGLLDADLAWRAPGGSGLQVTVVRIR